jgi:site-specific DNA-methyltransferase (adenine-specific)
MRTEHLSDSVTVHMADCREIIPTIKVDAVVTDPPYGIQTLVTTYGRKFKNKFKTIEGDKTLNVCIDAFNLINKHQTNIWLAAFYSPRIKWEFLRLTADLDEFGEIIWDKRIPGMGTSIRYQHENIAFFKIGKPPALNDCFSVLTFRRVAGEHPHEKPVQVMHNLCSCIPGQSILDPFMGSGSTGVAAVQLHKKFVGIEIDPKYFDIACRRIGEALKQPYAFWEEYLAPEQ